jgi:hypothetical protein
LSGLSFPRLAGKVRVIMASDLANPRLAGKEAEPRRSVARSLRYEDADGRAGAVPGLAPGKLNVEYVEGQVRWHVPDFFARAGGSAVVIDCRPAARRGPRDLAAFEATRLISAARVSTRDCLGDTRCSRTIRL